MWLPRAMIPAPLAADPWRRHLASRVAFSAIAVTAIAGAPAIVSAVAGWTDAGCLVRGLAGLPCPGCGVTTSLIALCAGDPARAWQNNPAGLAVAGALVSQAAVAGRGLRRIGDPASGRAWLRWQDRLMVAALGAAWVARLWQA